MSVWVNVKAWGKRVLDGLFYPLSAFLDAWLSVVTHQFVDPDLWGRLSVAALYFQTGRFPDRDVFSYTAPNARWVDHEWLSGFVFYGLITQFGEPALVLLHAGIVLMVLALMFGLHRQVYQVSGLYGFYGSLLLAPLYGRAFYPVVRSHVFSFLGFMGFVFLLEKIRLKQLHWRWLGVFPVLLALWGNLHGGVAMGFLVLGCYWLGTVIEQRSWRSGIPYGMAAVGGVVLLALLNPYGVSYWAFLIAAWTWDRSHIREWDPLPLGSGLFVEQQLLVLGVVVLLALNAVFRARQSGEHEKLGLSPALVLLLLVAMTLKSARLQSFLSIAVLAYLPLFLPRGMVERVLQSCGESLQSVFSKPKRTQGSLPHGLLQWWMPLIILIGSVGGLCFLGSHSNLLTVPVSDELSQGTGIIRYPVAAIRYLQQSPYRGNLLVRFGLGEFAYWQLYPRFKVSMDGRYEEVYSQAQFLANDAFFDRQNPSRSRQAAAQIHQTPADFILIESDMPNVATLEQSGQWQQLYGDSHFLVYGRKTLLPYAPKGAIINSTLQSIGDFVTRDTLQRFAR